MTSSSAKPIEFTNKDGEALFGRLYLPVSGQLKAFGIFAHCFTCSSSLTSVKNICRSLAGEGFAILSFDFTGLGESSGEFEETNFKSNVQDLMEAAQWLTDNYSAPAFLMGHSLGGAAVLHAARRLKMVQAVITLGAPADPSHVVHLFQDQLETIKQQGEGQVKIGGRTFTIKKQFLEAMEDVSGPDAIGQLKKPLLILHSPTDEIVGIDNARIIYENAKHPKSFVSLDGASHLLTKREDAQFVSRLTASWLDRYIKWDAPKKEDTGGKVVARLGAPFGQGKFTTEIRTGQHSLLADEPASLGGDDLGPSPYDLLLSALGACTAMTLKMYAERKEWPLESVTVKLKHDKIHAADCADCETADGKVDQIERQLIISGNLDEEQRKRLQQIADMCPVHKTLHNEVKVKTELQAK